MTTDEVMTMLEGVGNDQGLSQKINELRKYVEESFLKVNVYFKSSTAEIIVEAPRYEKLPLTHPNRSNR